MFCKSSTPNAIKVFDYLSLLVNQERILAGVPVAYLHFLPVMKSIQRDKSIMWVTQILLWQLLNSRRLGLTKIL